MTDATPPHAPLPQTLRKPRFQAIRVITALMLREMGTTYGRSPGGYVWAVLSPVGAILLLSLAFSLLLRTPSLGTSFILFYATGYLPYNLYAGLAQKIGVSMRFSKALLAYPTVGWLHAVLARFILNTLTGIVVFCIVLIGINLIVDTRATLKIVPAITGLGMAACIGFGIGTMNCFLSGLYPVWTQVWTIVTRPLFLASGILYIYEDLPQIGRDILWWNPLIHATGSTREAFYSTYHATYVSEVYGFGLPLVIAVFSMLLLRKYNRTLLER